MRKKRKTICILCLVFSLLLGNISFAAEIAEPNTMIQIEAESLEEGLDNEVPADQEDPNTGQTEMENEIIEEREEETPDSGDLEDPEPSEREDLPGSEESIESIAPAENSELTEEDRLVDENGLAEENGLTGIYYQWQTIDEILELCEQGLNLQDFFQYTIWGFLTPELLQGLADNGHDLDDVYEVLYSGNFDASEDIMAVIHAYAHVPMAMSMGDTRTAGVYGKVSSALGNIPALGTGFHGQISKLHLSGETAFCARFGAALRSGMVYTSVPLSEIGIDSEQERIIRGLLAQYAEAQSIYNGPVNYIMTQACVWLVRNGQWTGNPAGMAQAIAPLFSKTPDCPSVEYAADYFKAIVAYVNDPANADRIASVGLEAWANGPNQYLITATGEGGPLEEVGPYAHIEITKTDSETGRVIADNAEFTIYEWNGGSYEKTDLEVNREGDKYISEDLIRTDKNEGRFCVEESLAPHTGSTTGYYGDFDGSSKRRYEFEVGEDMKGDTIEITNRGNSFENNRTTGSIKVKKTDIEADAYVTEDASHGIAVLDGAVYDLYAAADILHPDGVTGTVYQKDQLVGSAVIRGGECEYTNLYLGSYYIKERQKGETLSDGKKLSYAEGYLLDETTYYVTLPYEGETVRNVHREVNSDKEQVIKAKAVIEKVESAAGQGNINYLEGAGFTIYRIDRLSKKDSFTVNADGSYNEESIRKAYLVEGYDQDTPKYDFRGENAAIATLYIRDTDMRVDTAHYWQDGKADLAAGKLIPLGNHSYRVAELFSDENGQVVTPYLPYGQYIVVETTVPEDHFQAPPFILTFNKGRTTKVITTGVTENTPYGQNLLKSSGDAAASYEAVYFSQIVDNEAIEELLRIYKKDTDTGKTVLLADTKFRIAKVDELTGLKTYLTHTSYYPDTVNRDVFCTNAEGYLQLPELLAAGTYQIEEVDGPNGFYNDVPAGYVKFRVTTDRAYISLLGSGPDGSTLEGDLGNRDVILIIEDYFNRETRGELTIRKQGEVLTGYKEVTLIEKLKALLGMDSVKQFVYEELPLANAEYTIRAAEDVVTQDRQLDEDGNRTLWFAKGDTVAVLTTGEDGQIDEVKLKTEGYPDGHPIVTVIHDGDLGSVKVYLPLGSYEIEETKAPYGYTRSTEINQVTFTWEHQFQEYVFNSAPIETTEESSYDDGTGALTITNARVKAVPEDGVTTPGIGIYKRAKEMDTPLSGVTFGFYTVDAIYTREGVKLAGAGELLSTCVTGEDGKAAFDIDIPIRDEFYGIKEPANSGIYEIRELDTPNGILLDDTPIPVTFDYVDEQTEFVVIAKKQQNTTSEVYISKQDMADSSELKGATLSVTEEWSGTVVQSWVSDGTRKEIRGLAVNENVEDNTHVYVLREESAPEGYLVAESIRFKLVRIEAEGDELNNSVYVWNQETGTWNHAADKTVAMKDRYVSPETPSGTPEEHHHSGRAGTPSPTSVAGPQTGDHSPIGLYLVLLVIAAVAGGISFYIYKKRM